MLPPSPMPPHALALSVSLRQGRLIGATVLTVGVLAALTAWLRHGVVLHTIDKNTTTAVQRATILDNYNSYSGNVASAFARPLEIFIGVMAQLLVLRVLASSVIQSPQPSWRIAATALVLGASMGFLVNNGFNALNVQLIEADVRPVVVASDLTAAATDTALRVAHAAKTSNVSQSTPETQPQNPVTNTILRNVVLQRVPKPRAQCTMTYDDNLRFPDDVVDYGFAQHEWMKQMLPVAVDAQRLRVVINATDESVNKAVTSERLPMNASRAADLFLTSVLLSHSYIPWGAKGKWFDRYSRPESEFNTTITSAVVAGLLPPSNDSAAATEESRRRWFLEKSQQFHTARPIDSTGIPRKNIVMEFARVDLSPSIAFESITWEVESHDIMKNNTITVNGSSERYTEIGRPRCGPVPGVCLLERDLTDTPVTIHAFAACANTDGSETLQSLPKGSTLWDYFIECPSTSNTSLLVISATKRIVMDALQENATVNETGVFEGEGTVVATNLRKVYSFTVGRLGWNWENLAEKYGADCQSPGQCKGLDFGLVGGTQRLLVGAESVPMGLTTPLNYKAKFDNAAQHPLPIVNLMEPARTDENRRWDALAGSVLLPHNAGNLTWGSSSRSSGRQCDVEQEDRIQLVLNNHLYMEDTLQSTYTAAMFFLFQNGVVKDTITLTAASRTLAFDGNEQKLDLRLSIPKANAVLTFIGCLVLVGGLAFAMVWSYLMATKRADPLQHITMPHVIARVMLDDLTFPSMMLTREINGTPAEHFLIDSLVLQHQRDDDRSLASVSMSHAAASISSPVGISIVTPTHGGKNIALLSKQSEA